MTEGSKPQILVVDDDPSIRESLGLLLSSVGYEVSMAENGVRAVSHLNRTLPDLIVTDINMPEMSGIELILHVRNQYPSISVVAMSGDYHGDAVPAGVIADRFYPKGQHPHHLLKTIASLIATSPDRRRAAEQRIPLSQDA
jgi:CheY-like chemotaxis protein